MVTEYDIVQTVIVKWKLPKDTQYKIIPKEVGDRYTVCKCVLEHSLGILTEGDRPLRYNTENVTLSEYEYKEEKTRRNPEPVHIILMIGYSFFKNELVYWRKL